MNKEEALLKIDELKKFIESIDKQEEIKLSVKDFILETINGCTIKTDNINYPNSIFYFKNDKLMFEYNRKSEVFWLSYKYIWSVLETKYGLNYKTIKELTKGILEEHFNCKVKTTDLLTYDIDVKLEEYFNCKVKTTGHQSNY